MACIFLRSGNRIFLEEKWFPEQYGRARAKFGRGFSVDNLENMRKFYLTYRESISETASRKSGDEKSETVSQKFEAELAQLLDEKIENGHSDFDSV